MVIFHCYVSSPEGIYTVIDAMDAFSRFRSSQNYSIGFETNIFDLRWEPLDHHLLSTLLFFWYHPFSGICSTSWLPSLIQRGCWASRVKRKVIPLLIEVNISRYKESIVMVGWPYPIYIVSNSTFWTWHMCSSCVFVFTWFVRGFESMLWHIPAPWIIWE